MCHISDAKNTRAQKGAIELDQPCVLQSQFDIARFEIVDAAHSEASAPSAYAFNQRALRDEVNRHLPGDHLLLCFWIEADVACHGASNKACLDKFSDSAARHRCVISDDCEVAFPLPDAFIHDALGGSDPHEPARSTSGPEGMRFFPLVFSLFMFILVSNVVGIIPYQFTVATHLIVTVALSLLVFFIVLFYGLYKNGLKFFKIFVPSGVPIYILPLVVVIEVILPEAGFAFGATVREHAGRPHRAESVRELCRYAWRFRLDWLNRCRLATWLDRGANRARTAGRVPAGLRLRHPHLHLPQRCYPSGPLRPGLSSSGRSR